MDVINLHELEALAKERLSPMAYDYYASGAHDELTLRENVAAFARLPLHYRVLVDVSARDFSTTVLGQRVSMPVLVAPTAFHKLACAAGEVATARAAGAAGTVMILSSLSNTPLEEVTAAATGPACSSSTSTRTARPPRPSWPGRRPRAVRRSCSRSTLRTSGGASATCAIASRFRQGSRCRTWSRRATAPSRVRAPTRGSPRTWPRCSIPRCRGRILAWLRSITRLPVVVKGVVRPDDARRAVDHGAHAIVVSNHGGRQLDTSPATLDALGPIVDAVGAGAEVLMDGGVRRGTDVLKALALGARAVLIGRPVLWGLAVDGEAGARQVLQMLRDELDLAMALAGCPRIQDVTRDLVGR